MQDTALILVETQREWLHQEGRLCRRIQNPADVESASAALLGLLTAARAAKLPIVHAHLRFSPGHPELGDADFGLRRAIRAHSLWTDEGADPAAGFEPLAGEFVLRRSGASAFAGSGLDAILRNNSVRRIIVAGAATHVCVLATAIAAHDLSYGVVMPREANLAFTEEQTQFALDEVAPHFAWVKPLAATLDHLGRRASLVSAVEAFLSGLQQGDVSALSELLDPELRVEGWLDDSWQCWPREVYLERVRRLATVLRAEQPPEIGRVDLVGSHAEVHTRVHIPGGQFEDRLSWTLVGDRWRLRHKTFQFHPTLNTTGH